MARPKKTDKRQATLHESKMLQEIAESYKIEEKIQQIPHPKKRLFLESFYATLGNISQSCRVALIDRTTFYAWMKTDEEFNKLASEQFNQILDQAQARLLDRALNSDKGTPELIFFLKSRHPDYKPQNTFAYENQKEGVRFVISRGK